jgi:hypothetical protein
MNDGNAVEWAERWISIWPRGRDIIAYLLYYAFSVSNADRKIV